MTTTSLGSDQDIRDGPTQSALHELLINMLQHIVVFAESERATIFLFDESTNELWSPVFNGAEIGEIRFEADQGIAGHVMQSGEVLHIPDAYADERFNRDVDRQTGFVTRNILCAPIENYQHNRIGVIQVINKNSGAFDVRDQALLLAVATQSAAAIENAQLYDEVAELRENELSLKQQLEQQHRQLQEAYVDIEKSYSSLHQRLTGNRWSLRIGAGILTVLILGLFLWQMSGLNLDEDSDADRESGIKESVRFDQEAGIDFVEMVAEASEVSDWLQLNGNVQPKRWIEITSPIDATLLEVLFQFGDQVSKGQKLAVLDSSTLKSELRVANSQYIQAKGEFENIRDWHKSPTVAQARRTLEQEQFGVTRAKRELNSTKRLFDRGIVSELDHENAEISLRGAQRSLLSAEESLASVLEGGNAARLSVAQLNLDNADSRVKLLEDEIEHATLYSPADGVVFPVMDGAQERELRVGARVSKHAALVSIADLSGITIESQVAEGDILLLKNEQPAVLSMEALPGKVLDGKILSIASRSTGETGRGSSASAGARFKVTVIVEAISEEIRALLRLGMSGTARVKIYHKLDAVVIPFDAVVLRDAEPMIRIPDEDGYQLQMIEVHATRVRGIEVGAGLDLGDSFLMPQFE